MKITGILGTTYLCSKFVNHDGTLVSDHPLYLFSTDEKDIALAVMFTTSSNPFTTKGRDGKDIRFICCSDHRMEVPTAKVFQSEVYIVNMKNANLKYSEYTFNNFIYHSELLKALSRALKEGLESGFTYGITSVHSDSIKDDVTDKKMIMENLLEYVTDVIVKKSFIKSCPTYGPVNTTYSEYKKSLNEYYVKNNNKKVFYNRYCR